MDGARTKVSERKCFGWGTEKKKGEGENHKLIGEGMGSGGVLKIKGRKVGCEWKTGTEGTEKNRGRKKKGSKKGGRKGTRKRSSDGKKPSKQTKRKGGAVDISLSRLQFNKKSRKLGQRNLTERCTGRGRQL